MFRICSLDELREGNCTGKGKAKKALDQEKLAWVLHTTASLSPVFGQVNKLVQMARLKAAINKGINDRFRAR